MYFLHFDNKTFTWQDTLSWPELISVPFSTYERQGRSWNWPITGFETVFSFISDWTDWCDPVARFLFWLVSNSKHCATTQTWHTDGPFWKDPSQNKIILMGHLKTGVTKPVILCKDTNLKLISFHLFHSIISSKLFGATTWYVIWCRKNSSRTSCSPRKLMMFFSD